MSTHNDIIDRGDSSSKTKKTNHRMVEEAKKEKKKQPLLDASAARQASANQTVKIDPYAPCAFNVCNDCGKIMNSGTSKPDHMKTHGRTIPCTKTGCGCYYATQSDLRIHLSLH